MEHNAGMKCYGVRILAVALALAVLEGFAFQAAEPLRQAAAEGRPPLSAEVSLACSAGPCLAEPCADRAAGAHFQRIAFPRQAGPGGGAPASPISAGRVPARAAQPAACNPKNTILLKLRN